MINVFSTLLGTVIYMELVFIVVLLKPLKEPYFIRDCWCKVQENIHFPSNLILIFTILLIANTSLEIAWEYNYNAKLLNNTNNSEIIWNFYLTKMSISFTCSLIALYMLIVIERVTQFLIIIARLLDFELMCRHAILTRDDSSQKSNTTVAYSTIKHVKPKLNDVFLIK